MIKFVVTFEGGHRPLTYGNVFDAVKWGYAPRWGAYSLYRVVDGKREALIYRRGITTLGRACGITS
jgi:hypothetical protein